MKQAEVNQSDFQNIGHTEQAKGGNNNWRCTRKWQETQRLEVVTLNTLEDGAKQETGGVRHQVSQSY